MAVRGEAFRKLGRPAAELSAAIALQSFIHLLVITAYNHRQLTHRSLELSPLLQAVAEFDQRTYGASDGTVWASVHRTHHAFRDATLKPEFDIHRAHTWINEHPDDPEVRGFKLPEKIPYLDPYIPEMSLADALTIGKQAVDYVKERVGDKYKEPEKFTRAQLNDIFYPQKPLYFYPTEPHQGEYTLDDVAGILLGDAHSPARIPLPDENGVRYVLQHNIKLYSEEAKLYLEHPELKPSDLQHPNGKNRRSTALDYAGGILAPSLAVLLRRHKFAPKDFAIALAAGVAIWGGGILGIMFGGNFVNSYGHAGELNQPQIIEAFRAARFRPYLNEDGSISTDPSEAGLLLKLFGIMTLGEVTGQGAHHDRPQDIAYTSRRGIRGWMEDPYGKALETFADSKLFPFIRRGKGFNLAEGQTRPDDPHPAVLLIEKRRAEYRNAA